MRIFLTSGTGYVGRAVAEGLKQEGHEVVGMGRSRESRQKLEAGGIHAVEGDLRDPERVGALAAQADAAIHTAQDKSGDTGAIERDVVAAILRSLEDSGRPFLYTSGVWVYGSPGEERVTEESLLAPPPVVAWRPSVEEQVLVGAQRGVDTVVIRPGVVYGADGGLLAMLAQQAREEDAVPVVAEGKPRWSFVHRKDMAELYVKALEARPGSLYNATAGPSPTLAELARAVSLSVGGSGKIRHWPMEEARSELGPVADALALDQPNISSEKAQNELGWVPRQPPVLTYVLPSVEGGRSAGADR